MFSSNHYAFNLTQDQDQKVMVLCGTDGESTGETALLVHSVITKTAQEVNEDKRSL